MDLSQAQCVKSRRSSDQGGQCVEVSAVPGQDIVVSNKQPDEFAFLVRDSKNPSEAPLVFTRAEWDAFVEGVKEGEFDSEKLLAAMKAVATAG